MSIAVPPARPARRSRRPLAVLAAVGAILLASCAPPGQVRDFDETVQENFIEACREANVGGDGDVDELCVCWWDAVVEEFEFSEFRSIDRELRDQITEGQLRSPEDLRRLQPRLHEVIASCQVAGPVPPA